MNWQDAAAFVIVALAIYGIYRRITGKKKGNCEKCGDHDPH